MLKFICESRSVIESNWNNVTFDLVPVIYSQIQELPAEVMSGWDGNNHVQYCLNELFYNAECCPLGVRARLDKLRALLAAQGLSLKPTEEARLQQVLIN